MAIHRTHKATAEGKTETLARKAARMVKYTNPKPARSHVAYSTPIPFGSFDTPATAR